MLLACAALASGLQVHPCQEKRTLKGRVSRKEKEHPRLWRNSGTRSFARWNLKEKGGEGQKKKRKDPFANEIP
jgi:hypothetical protein